MFFQNVFSIQRPLTDEELLKQHQQLSSQYSGWLKEAKERVQQTKEEWVGHDEEIKIVEPSSLSVPQMGLSDFMLTHLNDNKEEENQDRLAQSVDQTIKNLVENQLSGSMWRPLIELINNGVDHSQSNVAVEVVQENEFIRISVKDRGNGMTGDQIKKYLLNPYQSSNAFLSNGQQDAQTTGRFGMGFFSHLALIKEDSSHQSYSQVFTRAKGTDQIHEVKLQGNPNRYIDVQVTPDLQEQDKEMEHGTEIKIFLKMEQQEDNLLFLGKRFDQVVDEIESDLQKYLSFRDDVGISLNGQRVNIYGKTLKDIQLKNGQIVRWGLLKQKQNAPKKNDYNQESTLTFLVNGTAITSERLGLSGGVHLVIDLPSQFPLSSDRETIGTNSQEERAYLQEIGRFIFDSLLEKEEWTTINQLYKKWSDWGLYDYVLASISTYLDQHPEYRSIDVQSIPETKEKYLSSSVSLQINLVPLQYAYHTFKRKGLALDSQIDAIYVSQIENNLLWKVEKVGLKKVLLISHNLADTIKKCASLPVDVQVKLKEKLLFDVLEELGYTKKNIQDGLYKDSLFLNFLDYLTKSLFNRQSLSIGVTQHDVCFKIDGILTDSYHTLQQDENFHEITILNQHWRSLDKNSAGLHNYRQLFDQMNEGNLQLKQEKTKKGLSFVQGYNEVRNLEKAIGEENFQKLFQDIQWMPPNIYVSIQDMKQAYVNATKNDDSTLDLASFCPMSYLGADVPICLDRYRQITLLPKEKVLDTVTEMKNEWNETKETFLELLSQDKERMIQKKLNEQEYQVKDLLVSVNKRNELFYLNNLHTVSLDDKKKRVQMKVDLVKTLLDFEDTLPHNTLTPPAYAFKMNLISLVSQWFLTSQIDYNKQEQQALFKWIHQTAQRYQEEKSFVTQLSSFFDKIFTGYLVNQQDASLTKETWLNYFVAHSEPVGQLKNDILFIGNELLGLLSQNTTPEPSLIEETLLEKLPEEKELLWNIPEYNQNFLSQENSKRALMIASNQNSNKFFEIKERIVNSLQAQASEVRIAVQKVEGKDEIVLIIDDNGDGVPLEHIMAFIVPDSSYGEGKISQGDQKNFGRGSKVMWGKKGRNLWVWSHSKKTGEKSLRVFSRPQDDTDFSVYMHQSTDNQLPFAQQPFFDGQDVCGTRVVTNYKKSPEEVAFMVSQLEQALSTYPFETFYLNNEQIKKQTPLFQNEELAIVFAPHSSSIFDSTPFNAHHILPSQLVETEYNQFRVMRRHEAQNVTRTKVISVEMNEEEKLGTIKQLLPLQQTLSVRNSNGLENSISHQTLLTHIQSRLKQQNIEINLWKAKEDFMKGLSSEEKSRLENLYLDFLENKAKWKTIHFPNFSEEELNQHQEELNQHRFEYSCEYFLMFFEQYRKEVNDDGYIHTKEAQEFLTKNISLSLIDYFNYPNLKYNRGMYVLFRYLEGALNYQHKKQSEIKLSLSDCLLADQKQLFHSTMGVLDDIISDNLEKNRLLNFINTLDNILPQQQLKGKIMSFYFQNGVQLDSKDDSEDDSEDDKMITHLLMSLLKLSKIG